MRPSGHRAIRALAPLMVLLLGASILFPLGVFGQAHEINGRVSGVCPGPGSFVVGAQVTLIDANGVRANLTTTTTGGGVYTFAPPLLKTGSYIVAANRSGYYPGGSTAPARFDGTATKTIDVCMEAHGSPTKVLTVTVQSAGSPVSGARVTALNTSNPTGTIQQVTTGTTNAMGIVNLTLWPATFRIRASAASLPTVESTVDVAVVSSTTINLAAGVSLFGFARNSTGSFVQTGVVAWLYNPAQPPTSPSRLIPATVSGSYFQFEDSRAPAGSYRIIVDAKGYQAQVGLVTLPFAGEYMVSLAAASHERYETTVLYGTRDWNNVTVWRNLTLNADSTLPGLLPANLRSLRLQIDATLGNGNGDLQALEVTAFQNWLQAKGPAYVTTDDFLTTNSKAHNSSEASFTLADVDGVAAGPITNGPVWINTSTNYTLKQAPPYIDTGAKTYYLNMTLVPDADLVTYQNFTYTVSLPQTYERNETRSLVPASSAILTNFTRFTIDPIVGDQTVRAELTVSQALNGTARAKVTGPPGKFHVQNASFTNFQALVANNTTLTFSAQDSTDPNSPITNNNFTWRFTPDAANDTRWGIEPTFKYTRNGTFTVNLTMAEAGGNVSFRDITIHVDDVLPLARIRTNRTGSAAATELKVDEGIPVRFDGSLSRDLAFPGKDGVILDAGYAWDFNADGTIDATGRIVNHTFDKPGPFQVNLTVTDSVGWKSANWTLQAQVNDTTAPVPAFDILDPSNEYERITSPIELRSVTLNASKTTDEYDTIDDMFFSWTIPGPVVGLGTNVTLEGRGRYNVTFQWQEWNNSYEIKLKVQDTGFGLPDERNNTGYLNQTVTVAIDPLLHADLQVLGATLTVDPADPEEGAPVTVTVNVTNKAGRKVASDVRTQLAVVSGGVTTVLTTEAQWLRDGVETQDRTIQPGSTVTIVMRASISGQGNKTLEVNVYDESEPYTWRPRSDNVATKAVNVRQPWWQPYAVVAAVVGVIALAVFGMYARRKIKAGEWRPIRGRRGERGAEEKPRREVKEEKKRL